MVLVMIREAKEFEVVERVLEMGSGPFFFSAQVL
jgi:hypothetical protein